MLLEIYKTLAMFVHQKISRAPGLMLALCFLCTSCGAVGSPIPPEDVGIEAKLREHRQQTAKETPTAEGEDTEEIPLEEEPVRLPPLHPIGTR